MTDWPATALLALLRADEDAGDAAGRGPEAATTTSSPTAHAARDDRPGKAAKTLVRAGRPIAPACGTASAAAPLAGVDRLEVLEQERPGIPGRARAPRRDVVAGARRDRDGGDRRRWRALRRSRAKSASIARNAASSKPTRSILFTASTTSRMPSSETMTAWRRVCVSRPLVASTSRMARSAVEAPVAMLRVYWTWPGVSATMKRRRGVAKKR